MRNQVELKQVNIECMEGVFYQLKPMLYPRPKSSQLMIITEILPCSAPSNTYFNTNLTNAYDMMDNTWTTLIVQLLSRNT